MEKQNSVDCARISSLHFKRMDWTSRDDRAAIRDYVKEMLGDPYRFVFKLPDVSTLHTYLW